MLDKTFTVKYLSSKTCFCYISDKNNNFLEKGNVLRIEYGQKGEIYTTCLSLSGLKTNEIGINVTFARSLGIKEHDAVYVSTSPDLPGVKSVIISPVSKDDYEIIELLADNIQNTMLNQVRVVNKNQKLIIWISNVHVTVTIDEVSPVSAGRLNYLTEVLVQSPTIQSKAKPEETPRKSSIWSMSFVNYFKKSTEDFPKDEDVFKEGTNNYISSIFRMHSIEDLKKCIKIDGTPKIFLQPFNVFVKRQFLPEFYKDKDTFEETHLVSLRVVQPLVAIKDFLDETASIKDIVARLCILEDFCSDIEIENICRLPSLFVNELLFKVLEVEVGGKVLIESSSEEISVDSIEIQPMGSKIMVPDSFRNSVIENCSTQKLVLNSHVPIKLNNGQFCLLKFSPVDGKYCLVDEDFIKKCRLVIGPAVPEFEESDQDNNSELILEEYCFSCSNYQSLLTDSVDILRLGFNINNYAMENILITGKPGTGKSTLAKVFVNNVNSAPYHIHTETVNCKNLKGKTIDSLSKIFTSVFAFLIYYQPSLLVLDDLDVLCEKVIEGDAPTQESLHYNRVSEFLAGIFEQNLATNCIAVLATAQSAHKLNQNIFSSRGRHFFKNVFTIKDLTKTDRKIVLDHLFLRKASKLDVDFDALALKTEGYVIQDLVDLVDKIIFEAYKARSDVITVEYCENALEKASSLSLRDVQLHSPGDRDFSDIGGLQDVKRILVESMLWPAQFSNLFGNSPLRLQSGLLLYGPPGTGKTILAGAAAKHCGLRLISIKGPELLSKYIGASEQAVRDVFQKAQSAKPCILFFDEFDSLAPRRGHDSTGVTDRVVNQFLTQLDGVETLTGVCVLAATSRPDLLDPALLRPGRLDKQILCPLPDKDSRLEILRSLSKNMVLSKNVSLEKIAGVTEHFSGADLQAVLYTAQLTSVENHINTKTGENLTKNQPEINQAVLMEALKTTRPSLTKDERMKYEKIYARFQGKADVLDIRAGKQRATLA